MSIDFHSTVVFCNDLKEQRDFYEKFLGQKVEHDLGVCIVFEKGFTLWKLKSEYPISKELGYTYEPIGNRNFELSFTTELFGDAVEKVLLSELRILHNVVEETWGQYTIRFYDPEGNLVEIGETLKCMAMRMREDGKSIEEIVDRSSLPKEYVVGLFK
jgi:catechol 2,3-dioxygenase-like lactoylglutathione lyase family enzyme